jgi:hypothetical protein
VVFLNLEWTSIYHLIKYRYFLFGSQHSRYLKSGGVANRNPDVSEVKEKDHGFRLGNTILRKLPMPIILPPRNSILKVLFLIHQEHQGSADQTDNDIIHLLVITCSIFLKPNALI